MAAVPMRICPSVRAVSIASVMPLVSAVAVHPMMVRSVPTQRSVVVIW